MNPERAWYLLANYDQFKGFPRLPETKRPDGYADSNFNRADGITPEEDQYIRIVLSMLSDEKSYYDAVCKIAGG